MTVFMAESLCVGMVCPYVAPRTLVRQEMHGLLAHVGGAARTRPTTHVGASNSACTPCTHLAEGILILPLSRLVS